MSRRLRVHPEAWRDIEAVSTYFEVHASSEIAERFEACARQSMESLRSFPGRGRVVELEQSRLIDIRCWPVKGFDRVLIYYCASAHAIGVLRVLHGSRMLEPDLFE